MKHFKNTLRPNFIKILGATFFSFLFISCGAKRIDGIGEVVVKTHLLGEFEEINISNGWKAILMEGEQNKMVVTANQNLHSALQYHIDGNTLFILSEKKIGKADDKTILIYHTQNIERIVATKEANIISNPLDQKEINVFATSGASIVLDLKVKNLSAQALDDASIRISGNAKNVEATAKDGGAIEAKSLTAENANTTATGNGTITILVKKEFIAEATGGGLIEYYGDPGTVSIQKEPGASIIKK